MLGFTIDGEQERATGSLHMLDQPTRIASEGGHRMASCVTSIMKTPTPIFVSSMMLVILGCPAKRKTFIRAIFGHSVSGWN